MGNGQTRRVAKIGDVKIKMYDECERVLIGVWHVPRCRRNLISLSILDQCWCKYKALGTVLNIAKRTLVVMKEMLYRGLYVLQVKAKTMKAVECASP